MSAAPLATLPAERAGTRRRVPRRLPSPSWPLAAAVAALTLVPLAFVVGYTVRLGAADTTRLVLRPRTAELLANTGLLIAGCLASCLVIGVGAAWLVVRGGLPGARAWNALLAAPLAVPAFVNSYAWASAIPGFDGLDGALIVVTLSYFPLVYLPVAAALRGLDPALEDAARSLGLGPWAVFGRVVLPQLRPALLGGSLLVALHLLAEFGALQMLRFSTLSTAIFDQFRSSFNGPAANVLAGVLVLCCLVLLLVELRLRGRGRYARLGSGAPRAAEAVRLGRLRTPALAGLAGLVVLALGVPLASLTRWLLVGASSRIDLASLAATTGTTLGLAAAAAVLVTAAALPAAWLDVRRPGPVTTLLERASYVGTSLPGIVVALALVTLAIHGAPWIYQTTPLLLVAYLILFLPRAQVAARSGLAQVPPRLEDAARALGAGPAAVLRRVTLPLMAPSLGAGAALVFLATTTELTATLLLAPIGTDTLATEFWTHSISLEYGAAAPYAAALVLLSVPATYLLTRQSGENRPVRQP